MATSPPTKGIKLNPKTISDLTIPKNATPQEIDTALKQWLSQLGGNYVKAYDGELVHFNNKQSVSHLINDGRNNWISAMAVGRIIEVITKGKPSQLEALKHSRPKDNMVQFKTYRKQCKIENLIADIEVKVGKLPKEKRFQQHAGKQLAYAMNLKNKKELEKKLEKISFTSTELSSKPSSAGITDSPSIKTKGGRQQSPKLDDIIIRTVAGGNTTLILDCAQDEEVIIVSVKSVIDPFKQKIALLNWQLNQFFQ